MAKCYRRYVARTALEQRGGVVLDIGGADVNGSYRALFPKFEYRIADLEAGPGVDIALADPYTLPLADASVDIVVSGQAFEHIPFFWRTFREMVRVLKDDGFIFLIAPSTGPEHRFPQDCYRFYADAYAALAAYAGCDLAASWTDERGPWCDLVGVFRRRGAPAAQHIAAPACAVAPVTRGTDEEEALAHGVSYLDVLARFHAMLQPRFYLEIGVRHGRSLALAACAAIGVDPAPEINVSLLATTRVIAQTSDDFFEEAAFEAPVDFAFIDGLHTFEQTLRDFMNVERRARAGAVALIDDVLPRHPAQAERARRTQVWMGDVWKLADVLRAYRPDLFLMLLDTQPGGLLLAAGLDPDNRVLWERYNSIMRAWGAERAPPPQVLAREGAVPVGDPRFAAVLNQLAASARVKSPPARLVAALRDVETPKLSLIVVCYNMAREIPRTIRSLAPAMQRGVRASDYEIILVDNGSTRPFDEAAVRALAPNVRIRRIERASASPVQAINETLALCHGDLIGVCIDGARMASPGLLANALKAAKLHPRPVIGTLAFHLGRDVQMRSVREGYDQATEDALLAASGWEENGYRLFGCSVFAGSSSEGWFVTPAESNAVFMRARHWRELGGFNAAFTSPGGGFVNLDLWARACADPSAELIMLLGEGTFHQVHGGVATNTPGNQQAFVDEYRAVTGKDYARPARTPIFFGAFPPEVLASANAP